MNVAIPLEFPGSNMPIELHTWAMAWVIAGQLTSGVALELREGPYRFHLKHIPGTVSMRYPDRSTIALQGPGFAVHRGQTPMGPGVHFQFAHSKHHLNFHQNGSLWWAQWSSPWPVLPQITYVSHRGWDARLHFGSWRLRLAPGGQSEVSLRRNSLRSLFSIQGERWQARLHVKHFYATAGGRGQWDYSRMGIARGGHYLEVYETHSLQGLDLQVMGRLKMGGYEFFGMYREGLGPRSFMGRMAVPFGMHWQSTLQYSSNPWLQQGSINYRGPLGRYASVLVHRQGGTLRLGNPHWSLDIQPEAIAFRIHHRFELQRRRQTAPLEETVLAAPQMRIQTTGILDHPVFRCFVVDAHGQSHLVHILAGEWQWKSHLPPGQYAWKPLVQGQSAGYTLNFEESTFSLESGETCQIRLHIEPVSKKITWLDDRP
ncbi:MAG: hypothetical protein RL168_409 [Bacteroidota bacterium]